MRKINEIKHSYFAYTDNIAVLSEKFEINKNDIENLKKFFDTNKEIPGLLIMANNRIEKLFESQLIKSKLFFEMVDKPLNNRYIVIAKFYVFEPSNKIFIKKLEQFHDWTLTIDKIDYQKVLFDVVNTNN